MSRFDGLDAHELVPAGPPGVVSALHAKVAFGGVAVADLRGGVHGVRRADGLGVLAVAPSAPFAPLPALISTSLSESFAVTA